MRTYAGFFQRLKVELSNFYRSKKDMATKTKWYVSSANPEELSLTIKGLLMMYIPFLITLGSYFNIPLTNSDLADLATSISMVISASIVLFGLARKLYYKLR